MNANAPQRHEDTERHLVSDAPDSFLKHWNVKVDDDAQLQFGHLQVRDHLHHVSGNDSFDRFQVDDHAHVDQKVQPSLADDFAAITQLQAYLSLETNPTMVELDSQGLLVSGFQMSGTQLPMHCDRSADDVVRNSVQLRIRLHLFINDLIARHLRRLPLFSVSPCLCGAFTTPGNKTPK